MKCKQAIYLMSDVIEHAVSDNTRIAFDRHLAGCRPCSLYLSQVRVTIELCAELRHTSTAPADLYRTLLAR